MLESAALPEGVTLVRSTPALTAIDLPPGLLAGHRLAASVWGVLRVLRGHVVFVTEDDGDQRDVPAGEAQVIEPGVRHHIEPSHDATLVIDFYR